ncbi:hypothetical protein RAMDARK_1386 [Rickettsia amblyommatis str. Darkwater]|uniref:Uncharacterized protein n=1 Tax=Rickettsia amblyommatis str. Ac/Pa TaxID=1359164 RepID=A0A0F3N418_RICAM|nr:hypothetical protein APHACPA_1804 [Rickettsia amblyommatis str. Ac/Pa]KJV90897.1 hypothetical protein RAMDARK_1386 [Rickettsia amblyommatis str. Darkwater]
MSLYIKHKIADCTDNRHIFFVKCHEFWRHIFIFKKWSMSFPRRRESIKII